MRIRNFVSDETSININDIKIDSNNNNIEINFKDGPENVELNKLVKNYILNYTNLLILKQKRNEKDRRKVVNEIILPNNGTNSKYQNNLYLGFKNDSLFEEVSLQKYSKSQNNDKFTITLNELENLQPYTKHNTLDNDRLMEDIKNALPVTKENLNVSYFIIKEDKLEELKEVYKQNVEESNKKSKRDNLIRAMQKMQLIMEILNKMKHLLKSKTSSNIKTYTYIR